MRLRSHVIRDGDRKGSTTAGSAGRGRDLFPDDLAFRVDHLDGDIRLEDIGRPGHRDWVRDVLADPWAGDEDRSYERAIVLARDRMVDDHAPPAEDIDRAAVELEEDALDRG